MYRACDLLLIDSLPLPSASFIGLLIYASIIFHRSRKGTLKTNYRSAPAGTGMEPLSHNTAYPSYNPDHAPPYSSGQQKPLYDNYRGA